MVSSSYDAVVVGGGVGGLVAARDLALAGLEVCVLEAANALGGRVQSTSLAGLPVELGAEAYATRGGAVAALLQELDLLHAGAAPDPAPAWLITPHAARELPESGALGIPARPLTAATRRAIGLRAALSVALEPWRPRTRHAPEASLADVARARIGERATNALIAPVTEGVYSAAPSALRFEAQHDLARAYERSGSLVRAAREVRASKRAAGGAVAGLVGGLSRLIASLESELRGLGVTVLTGASVSEIGPWPTRFAGPESGPQNAAPRQPAFRPPHARWRVRWAGAECHAAAVVLAVPPSEVNQLCGLGSMDSDAPVSGDCTAERSRASASDIAVEIVALVLDAPDLDRRPRGTGALIRPGHPNIRAKALTHATSKWSWLRDAAPEGRHVLRLSYGSRDITPATEHLEDEAAAALAVRDAAAIMNLDLNIAQLVAHHRARWRVPARAQPPALSPGLWCLGEAYSGTGLASVVPHARRVAREVAATFNQDALPTTSRHTTTSSAVERN